MKGLLSILAAGLLLAAANTALGADFIWNGSTSAYWDEANWELITGETTNYPGQLADGDTATIAAGTNSPVILDISLGYTLKTVDMDADTAGVDITLDIKTTGGLDTSGLVTVKGHQTDKGFATLVIRSASFTPAALRLWGRNDTVEGHAIADMDADITVDNDLTIRQHVALDVAFGKTVIVNGTFRIGNDLDDFFGYAKLREAGTIEAGTVRIEGDASDGNNASTLESSGTVRTK